MAMCETCAPGFAGFTGKHSILIHNSLKAENAQHVAGESQAPAAVARSDELATPTAHLLF